MGSGAAVNGYGPDIVRIADRIGYQKAGGEFARSLFQNSATCPRQNSIAFSGRWSGHAASSTKRLRTGEMRGTPAPPGYGSIAGTRYQKSGHAGAIRARQHQSVGPRRILRPTQVLSCVAFRPDFSRILPPWS